MKYILIKIWYLILHHCASISTWQKLLLECSDWISQKHCGERGGLITAGDSPLCQPFESGCKEVWEAPDCKGEWGEGSSGPGIGSADVATTCAGDWNRKRNISVQHYSTMIYWGGAVKGSSADWWLTFSLFSTSRSTSPPPPTRYHASGTVKIWNFCNRLTTCMQNNSRHLPELILKN